MFWLPKHERCHVRPKKRGSNCPSGPPPLATPLSLLPFCVHQISLGWLIYSWPCLFLLGLSMGHFSVVCVPAFTINLHEFYSYSISFWDVVVVTARDETQRKIYEHQISLKKERREIPLFAQYVCCVSSITLSCMSYKWAIYVYYGFLHLGWSTLFFKLHIVIHSLFSQCSGFHLFCFCVSCWPVRYVLFNFIGMYCAHVLVYMCRAGTGGPEFGFVIWNSSDPVEIKSRCNIFCFSSWLKVWITLTWAHLHMKLAWDCMGTTEIVFYSIKF